MTDLENQLLEDLEEGSKEREWYLKDMKEVA
jgi:hypothetical protein